MQILPSHELILSMVDGKVCNSLTNTNATMKCFICGALPINMNNIENVAQRSMNEEAFSFGISPLHARIRFYECLLHVAYRLDLKKLQVRGDKSKALVTSRKRSIQDQFRSQLGLLVDFSKQDEGNTNDGNSARKFFNNATVPVSITGIKEDIINRFGIILEVIASNRKIKVDCFQQYCMKTAKLFIENYRWFPMPVVVHKMLIHGGQIIKNSQLSVGLLSEETQEARNKDYRYFREHHTRKVTRLHTNKDLLKILLVSSDPVITSHILLPKKNSKVLSPEAMKLVVTSEAQYVEPDNFNFDVDSSDSDDNDK